MILIGLGQVGKNILSSFKETHRVLIIDDIDDKDFNVGVIKPGKEGKYKHEAYDSVDLSDLDLEQYREEEKFFVVSGGSDISGASLRLLKALGGDNTTVVYIKPSKDSLTNIEELQERVTYGVLQESARSGLIKQIILFDNEHISTFSGKISIKNYYSTINSHIVYALTTLLFCEENSQVFGKKRDHEELNRIVTLGRVHENQEVLLFPLTNIKNETQYPLSKTYCYLVPSKTLEEEDFLSEVKKELTNINGNLDEINFGIYEIKTETSFKLVIIETSLVQE